MTQLYSLTTQQAAYLFMVLDVDRGTAPQHYQPGSVMGPLMVALAGQLSASNRSVEDLLAVR